MVTHKDAPNDEVCINGRFVYTMKRKAIWVGHTNTEAYIDDERRLDARLRVSGFHGALWDYDHAPTTRSRCW